MSELSQETEIAVLKNQMSSMQETMKRIETNHLVHINDELRRVNERVESKFGELGNKMEVKFDQVNTSLIALKVTDAGAAPTNGLIWEIIKFVLMSVVGAVVGLVIYTKM